jgi:uncharacterized hydrophobic protein (TIGR00341 family)
MRLIQVVVPGEEQDAVEEVLGDRDIEFVRTAEAGSDERLLYQFPLQPEAVDVVLDSFKEAGLDPGTYTVVVQAETAWPEQAAETEHEDRISHEELRSRAVGMSPGKLTYYGMTVLSAVVATAGLLLDSPAIVVGSMVIAPQVGAALTASVGTALNERSLIREGFRDQVAGLLVAVLAAALFGASFRFGGIVAAPIDVTTIQQIGQRISPGLLSMAVGICAGGAGAVGLATALPVSLVGVMIAAALIPAAAAIGIGIAWQFPAVALGAAVLLLINAASINLVAFVALWLLGFRPASWAEKESFLSRVRAVGPTVGTVLLLVVAFSLAGVVTAGQIQVDTTVNDAVSDVVEQQTYEELELVNVRTRFAGVTPVNIDRSIRVTVARPADKPYPSLAGDMGNRIERRLGTEVNLTVTFVDQQQYTNATARTDGG